MWTDAIHRATRAEEEVPLGRGPAVPLWWQRQSLRAPPCDPVKAVAAALWSAVQSLTDVEAVEPTAPKRRKVSDPEEAISFYFSYCD